MKRSLLAILLLICCSVFAQNKKEQIAVLNSRIDSLQLVVNNTIRALDSSQQKIDELNHSFLKEQKLNDEKIVELDKLNEKINELNKKEIAKAFIEYKLIKEADNMDERYGTESEIKLYLKVENQKILICSDFGTPELDDFNKSISLVSEFSEKNFEVVPVSSERIMVIRNFFCSDCETQMSVTIYEFSKNQQNIWSLESCIGDCDNE